eukprot:49897-Eustigmatos_ZCMA.PRE.1
MRASAYKLQDMSSKSTMHSPQPAAEYVEGVTLHLRPSSIPEEGLGIERSAERVRGLILGVNDRGGGLLEQWANAGGELVH